MSYEIRAMVTIDGGDHNSGAYIKIGYRWFRLEQLPPDEAAEAESIVTQREAAMLKSLGLKGKA